LPFLRLTRDRRGFENTFLLHADRPGDRLRLLYWYRTAPGIVLGRSPLDEDAIRTIEDSHPDIDFDWPAILALSEVMTPEDEAPVRPQKRKKPQGPREHQPRDQRPRDARSDQQPADEESEAQDPGSEAFDVPESAEAASPAPAPAAAVAAGGNRLLDELVGREISARLRARYAEIAARIAEKAPDGAAPESWTRRAEALNPDLWVSPDAILEGVRGADGLYDSLKAELGG